MSSIQPAIAVIDLRVAGYHRQLLELNIEGLAREREFHLAARVRFDADLEAGHNPLLDAREATGARVVITPSLRHLREAHDWVTEWATIHTVRYRRVYPQGHQWRAGPR